MPSQDEWVCVLTCTMETHKGLRSYQCIKYRLLVIKSVLTCYTGRLIYLSQLMIYICDIVRHNERYCHAPIY